MRYTITNQHINFFIEHGFIEFEEIIDADLLRDAYKKVSVVTNTNSPLDIYKTGRDVFRKNTTFAKIAKNKDFAEISKLLTKSNKLQLAFDQIYKTCQIFEDKGSFETYFSFQDLACLAIIRLDNTALEYADSFQVPMQFSNVVFVNPQQEFDLTSLQIDNQFLFFIGYAKRKTIYTHNPKDLNNSDLKQFGYSYGDHLKPEYHPIVS